MLYNEFPSLGNVPFEKQWRLLKLCMNKSISKSLKLYLSMNLEDKQLSPQSNLFWITIKFRRYGNNVAHIRYTICECRTWWVNSCTPTYSHHE